MPEIKFPVAGGRNIFFPKEGTCPSCNNAKVHEPHAMAIVNFGALLMTDREKGAGAMSDDLDGFLRFIWHGAHNGRVTFLARPRKEPKEGRSPGGGHSFRAYFDTCGLSTDNNSCAS